MENLQGTFQKGLSSVQKGLQEGKEKFQNSQEIISLKMKISEKESRRAKLVSLVGEIAYMKIRKGEIDSTDFSGLLDEIKEVDKYIYNNLKIIEEKIRDKTNTTACKCGNMLMNSDKFCGACGASVEVKNEEDIIDYISCSKCEEVIPASSEFCSCCGYSIK
ncbi:zinc ribbon domain-containing protein [Gottschalkia acidurici]|nr:zinc ribbon domain-containing protein [Gottschalkia acidurici]